MLVNRKNNAVSQKIKDQNKNKQTKKTQKCSHNFHYMDKSLQTHDHQTDIYTLQLQLQ